NSPRSILPYHQTSNALSLGIRPANSRAQEPHLFVVTAHPGVIPIGASPFYRDCIKTTPLKAEQLRLSFAAPRGRNGSRDQPSRTPHHWHVRRSHRKPAGRFL